MTSAAVSGGIVLGRQLREQILRHALEEAPREACGLVVGLDGTAARVVPCRNDHPEPTARYRVHADDLRQVLSGLGDEDRELVAIYHSHPRSQPVPSPTDRAESRQWPRPAYLLATWRTGAPELRAYRLDGEWMREVPIGSAPDGQGEG